MERRPEPRRRSGLRPPRLKTRNPPMKVVHAIGVGMQCNRLCMCCIVQVLCMCCAYCLLSFLFLFFFLDSISLAGKRLCFCTCVILPTYSSWVVLGQRHCKLTRFIQMAIWWPFMRLFQFFLIKSVRTPELSWNFF